MCFNNVEERQDLKVFVSQMLWRELFYNFEGILRKRQVLNQRGKWFQKHLAEVIILSYLAKFKIVSWLFSNKFWKLEDFEIKGLILALRLKRV